MLKSCNLCAYIRLVQYEMALNKKYSFVCTYTVVVDCHLVVTSVVLDWTESLHAFDVYMQIPGPAVLR